MVKQPVPYFFFRNSRRGSAIIGALVMAGILALGIGVMLSSSNTAIRRSADRIAYEEAYQTALSGTHIARAWLMNPEMAGTMIGNGASAVASNVADTGSKSFPMKQQLDGDFPSSLMNSVAGDTSSANVESDLESIIQKAVTMNQQIMEDVKNGNYSDMYGPAVRFGDLAQSTTLSGGRKLVYTFPSSPVISFVSGPGKKGVVFKGTPTGGHKSYVEWVRLTTPGTDNETSASLRETTFIVEAKGVAEYAGVKKERVVQQRVLIKPNEPQNPLIGASEAILTQRFVEVKGQSSMNVHWGPVYARENLNLDFFNPITQALTGNNRKFSLSFKQAQKANIAGAQVNSGYQMFDGFVDEWLQYKTGVNGKIMSYGSGNSLVSLFDNVTDVNNVSYKNAKEFDFFQELSKGTFGGVAGSITQDQLTLPSQFAGKSYATGQQITTTVNNPYGLYNPQKSFAGALLQGSSVVDTRVNEFFDQMNYNSLRTYAEAHASYYIYDGKDLVNVATGVKGLPPMTMTGTDPLAPSAPSDKMLFIDSKAQDPTKPFTDTFTMPSFWKGVVYVNGSISFPGGGQGKDVMMRSPSQFEKYRAGQSVDASLIKTGTKVLVDGIVICNGVANADTGGGIVYGTVAAKGGVGMGANFSVFYNPANGEGRLRDTSSAWQPYNLVAGKLYEVKSGGLTDS